jgi:hypothetical protein
LLPSALALDYKNNNYAALTGLTVMAVFTALYFLLAQLKKILKLILIQAYGYFLHHQ